MQDSRASQEEHDDQPTARGTGPAKAHARGKHISAEPATAASQNHVRLISVFRAAPIGIGLVCNRVLMEVNDRLCEMTGYRPEELLGQNARLLYPTQEDYDYVGTVKYAQIAQHGTGTVETRWKRKDGEVRNILLSSTPLDPSDLSKGVTFTALDITDRERIRQQVENLARFPSENPYPVLRIARTGEILYANPASAALLTEQGTSAGGKAPSGWCALVRQALDSGHVREFEAEHGDLTFAFRAVPLPAGDYVNFYGIDISERKRAETKLAESEERYRSIFENAVLGVYRTTPDGRILAANPALVHMLGYDSFEELARRNLEQDGCFAPGYSRSLFKEAMSTSGQVVGLESNWMRRDGTTLFIRENARAVRDAQDNTLFYEGTVEDITARKKAEEDLQNIFNLSLDMVCIADINTAAFVKINPAFTQTLGYDEAELLSRSFLDFIHPDEVERTENIIREKLREGASVLGFENRYRCKDGSYRWLSWNSQPKPEQGLTYAVARDITKQKKAETALRESERRYRAVVEDQTEFICRFTPDRRVTFVNEAICRFFGRTREELIGKDFAGFMPPEEYHKLEARLAALTPETPLETHENRGLLPSGEEFWGQWTNRAIFDDARNLVEFQSVGRDVTERVRTVDALRKSEERYRLLIESASQPIFTLSRDGVYLLMNKAAAAALGGQPDDFTGKTIWELFPKDFADGHMADARRAIDSGHLVAVTRESVVRGEKRWYDARVQPIGNGGASSYALVILTDVTDAKRAEEALRRNEQLLREAEQVAHAGSFSRNLLTNAVTWSDETYRIFGYEPGEVSSSVDLLLRHIHPDDRDRFVASTEAAAQGGGPYDAEYRIIRSDGEERTVRARARTECNESGKPVRLFGAIQDVTEQHAIEAALRESETRFRELAELLPQTVFEIDAEGHLVFANHLALESFGYVHDELADLDVRRLFAAEDRERVGQNLRKRLTERSFEDYEYTAMRKDGTTFPVLLYSSPIVKDGRPVGLRGIILDITERQHAERALQESKAKLESVFESSPEAITVVDAEGTVEDCNPATLKILGLSSKEEILGHSCFEFVAQEHLSQARETLARAIEGGSAKNVELRLRRRPDDLFLAEVSASVMRNAAGETLGVIAIAADITQRKQTEELIRSERDRAQKYLDVAGVMFIALDTEGRITLVNKKGAEILGYEEDEIVGRDWFEEFVPLTGHQEVRAVFDRLMSGQLEPAEYFENCVVNRHGQERLIAWHNTLLRDDTGTIMGTLSSGEDITERQRAEEALRRSEHLLRESQKVANIGHYALDVSTGKWESSEILDRIFGIDENFTKNVDGWLEIIHPDYREEMSTYLSQHVLKERHVFDREYRIMRLSDGEVRWVWGLGRLELNADGEAVRMIGTIQDITERKEAEERLLAHQAKLKSLASELSLAEERERRRIAADLHDHACQSLALSKMKLQAVLDAAHPADEQTLRQICGNLNQSIESVRDLTFDLSSPTLYKFGLEAALEELLRDKLKGEHEIQCRFSDDGRPKPLTPDVRVLLFQSVRELLINIIKHAHADDVELDIRRERDSIRITVGDNGAGFDVAKTLSAPSRTRSVGLFYIRERLDYVGGQLEIDSHPGRGSRFTLIAPLEMELHVAKENHDGSEDSTR